MRRSQAQAITWASSATRLVLLIYDLRSARSSSGAPSTSASAAKQATAASSPSGCTRGLPLADSRLLLGGIVIFARAPRRSRSTSRTLLPPTSAHSSIRSDTNKALYSLATRASMLLTIWSLVVLGNRRRHRRRRQAHLRLHRGLRLVGYSVTLIGVGMRSHHEADRSLHHLAKHKRRTSQDVRRCLSDSLIPDPCLTPSIAA